MRYTVKVPGFYWHGIEVKPGGEIDSDETMEIRANIILGRLAPAAEEIPMFLKRKANANSRSRN
jgi:hypothetical protein